MKKWLHVLMILLVFSLLMFLWRQHHQFHQLTDLVYSNSASADMTSEPITPLPRSIDLDQRKVALGEQLFNDVQLSRDNSISCASCHSLSQGGTDRLIHSVGIGDQAGPINAPTVFNSGFNFKQFWDGRAETLEEQVDGPTHNPTEMGSNWQQILEKLGHSPTYVRDFHDAYSDGLQSANVRDAIATFERSLITPNSPFDRYLRGEKNALTTEEREGYRLFKEYGCASCHQGINIGGNLFEKFGVMGNYFDKRGQVTKADLGRFNLTNNEADRYVFKVPSLRNVALTPPYFHDGSAEQLEDAVTIMSVYQLGRPLTASETEAIVKFLKTLTGEYQDKAL
jgi:cytochrome c peroxidase